MLQKLIKEELFGLAVPEDFGVHNGIDTMAVGSRHSSWSRKLGSENSHLQQWAWNRDSQLRMAQGFETSNPTPSNILPPARPNFPNFPKQWLEIKYSNTRAHGDILSHNTTVCSSSQKLVHYEDTAIVNYRSITRMCQLFYRVKDHG